MNRDTWKNIIGNLFLLCGIRPMDEKNHAMYIASMYSELKDKFTDQEIGFAARQIAENENLYGNYPPLSVWLKYCPARRAQQLQDKKITSDFISDIQDIYLDPIVHVDYTTKRIVEKYGKRGEMVLRQFGGVSNIRQRGFYGTQRTREILLNDIQQAWNETRLDDALNVLQITENRYVPMIEKNDSTCLE